MANINWNEFKVYKTHSHKTDNFLILLDFIKSYYNMMGALDIYNTIAHDETGALMLKKRNIADAEGLEKYLFGH